MQFLPASRVDSALNGGVPVPVLHPTFGDRLMRRTAARSILALAVVASPPLAAQSAPMTATGKLVPVSDTRSDWLDGGVESPNGRFYLLDSYASNDSGSLR